MTAGCGRGERGGSRCPHGAAGPCPARQVVGPIRWAQRVVLSRHDRDRAGHRRQDLLGAVRPGGSDAVREPSGTGLQVRGRQGRHDARVVTGGRTGERAEQWPQPPQVGRERGGPAGRGPGHVRARARPRAAPPGHRWSDRRGPPAPAGPWPATAPPCPRVDRASPGRPVPRGHRTPERPADVPAPTVRGVPGSAGDTRALPGPAPGPRECSARPGAASPGRAPLPVRRGRGRRAEGRPGAAA